jgi:uncharacterized protein
MVNVNNRKQINQTILKYVEYLKKEYNIKGIYLYGSHAKGNNTEDSDIDIAVISEDFTGDIIEDTFRLMKLRRKVDYRIEPHPFAVDEFNEDNPNAKEIMQTGIKIV